MTENISDGEHGAPALKQLRDSATPEDELHGKQIHYVEQPGSGTPVVMLHGLPATHKDFDPLVPKLPGMHLFAIDRPGFGWSNGGSTVLWTVRPKRSRDDKPDFRSAVALPDCCACRPQTPAQNRLSKKPFAIMCRTEFFISAPPYRGLCRPRSNFPTNI